MKSAQIERRLRKIETELAELREHARQAKANGTAPWWVTQAGQFADDPVYAEIVRRGREYRESTKPRRGKRK